MSVKLVRRKNHPRRLKSGRTISVAENWATYATDDLPEKPKSTSQLCPQCGEEIRTVRMPNGGWSHFEAATQSKSIKHACFYRGKGLSKMRDPKTGDLFEQSNESAIGEDNPTESH